LATGTLHGVFVRGASPPLQIGDARRPGVSYATEAALRTEFRFLSLSLSLSTCLFLTLSLVLSRHVSLNLEKPQPCGGCCGEISDHIFSAEAALDAPSTPRAVHSRRAGRYARGIKPPQLLQLAPHPLPAVLPDDFCVHPVRANSAPRPNLTTASTAGD